MNREIKHLREFGKFRLDTEKKVLWVDGKPVNVQIKEIELLCVLTENVGEVVTKDELLNRVWTNSFVEESNLSRHIYRLRKVFKDLGESADLIQTVPRRGYRFAGQIHENGNDEVIFERHSLTRTLVEELENSVEPNVKIITDRSSPTIKRRLLLPLAACLVILTTAFGFYFYDRRSAAGQPIRSIAVLPLKSLSDDGNKALSLGFADALITRLGMLGDVKIISINAVSRWADETQEPLEIGKKLAVDAVMDGTLQRANGKLRVTLRLFRVVDGRQIWTDAFDESESRIFNLQDAMATQTANALALNLKPKDRPKRVTDNLDAYNNYLQGEYYFRRRETLKSGTFFKKAVELDPRFAKAWAGLAAGYAMGDEMGEAETTVDKALALEPDLAEAHAVRGFIKMFLKWDWAEAETSLNTAVRLDANSVEAHHWRGIYLAIRRRQEEAKTELQRALELDPTSANLISDLGQVYYFAHEYEKAEEYYKKAMAMDDNFNKGRLIALYERQGRAADAAEMRLSFDCRGLDESRKLKCLGDIKNVVEKAGLKGLAARNLNIPLKSIADQKLVEGQLADSYYGAALSYLRLADKERAVENLTRIVETKAEYEIMNFSFPFIAADPTFDELRDDPRFQEILRKMNL